mmetsp:Transcript_47658/g.93074  ORF Transcript_47658/g.93074 Transcript_47658/m.93074 type:complete len:374 (+) Transcript_47658:752-1873(+)
MQRRPARRRRGRRGRARDHRRRGAGQPGPALREGAHAGHQGGAQRHYQERGDHRLREVSAGGGEAFSERHAHAQPGPGGSVRRGGDAGGFRGDHLFLCAHAPAQSQQLLSDPELWGGDPVSDVCGDATGQGGNLHVVVALLSDPPHPPGGGRGKRSLEGRAGVPPTDTGGAGHRGGARVHPPLRHYQRGAARAHHGLRHPVFSRSARQHPRGATPGHEHVVAHTQPEIRRGRPHHRGRRRDGLGPGPVGHPRAPPLRSRRGGPPRHRAHAEQTARQKPRLGLVDVSRERYRGQPQRGRRQEVAGRGSEHGGGGGGGRGAQFSAAVELDHQGTVGSHPGQIFPDGQHSRQYYDFRVRPEGVGTESVRGHQFGRD